MRKPSSESKFAALTLKMAPAQVVETSVTNNSPSQDSSHPGDLFQLSYFTPGVKPFSYLVVNFFDNAAAVHQSYCPLLLNKARSLVSRGQRPQAWVAIPLARSAVIVIA